MKLWSRSFCSAVNNKILTSADRIILLFSFEKATVSLRECRTGMKQVRGLHALCTSCKTLVHPLPLGERRTLDVDEACEINVKGIMALLLAQQ